jgi:hypothetical protein
VSPVELEKPLGDGSPVNHGSCHAAGRVRVNGHDEHTPSDFPSEGPACRVHWATVDCPFCSSGHDRRAPPILPSEGPASQVRRTTLDNPLRFNGHDRRAPPISPSEGRARRVRRTTWDHPFQFRGHDRRALSIQCGILAAKTRILLPRP